MGTCVSHRLHSYMSVHTAAETFLNALPQLQHQHSILPKKTEVQRETPEVRVQQIPDDTPDATSLSVPASQCHIMVAPNMGVTSHPRGHVGHTKNKKT